MLVDEPIKNIESEDYPDDFNKVVAQRFSDYGVTDGKQLEELLTSKSGEYESRIAELEAQLKEVSTKGLVFEIGLPFWAANEIATSIQREYAA